MGIKKTCANILLNASKIIGKSGAASFGGYGVEKMPESMRNER